MKVVYNTCFGGFGISKACAEWLAARGNLECINMLEDLVRASSNLDRCIGAGAESTDDFEERFHGGLYDTPRHDAILIMAVEHLGTRKASGSSAELKVHELKGDRYYIDEYDGSESVVEPKDINWIVV
jgi:hypothetical protein